MELRKRQAFIGIATIALIASPLAGGAIGQAATAASPDIGAHAIQHPLVASGPKPVKVAALPAAGKDAAGFSCQTTPLGTPNEVRCYEPAQIRHAYGVDKLSLNGAGQTITILDAFGNPDITRELSEFDSLFSIQAPPAFNIIAPDGTVPFSYGNDDQVGWAGEIALDVEWSHVIAPDATIDLVISKTDADADFTSAETYIADQDLGDVLSQSFGEAESCEGSQLTADHALYNQMEAENISVLASSGDDGAAQPSCDGSTLIKAVGYPASDPDTTGVGGTQLNATYPAGTYVSERAVQDGYVLSGGGLSTVFSSPSYQQRTDGHRGVPDVSYNAAVDGGVLTVWNTDGNPADDGVYVFGGTSAGSPQWAGLVALVDQSVGHSVGALNPTLYSLSANKATYASLFHDITLGNNTNGSIIGYKAGTGSDLVTGLGSPRANALVPALAAAFGSAAD
jgi:subtilase family serine protease